MAKIVIALGGNAIISAKEKGTTEQQLNNISHTTKHLSQLIKAKHQLVIAHGNGPQIGNLLIQHDTAKNQVPALSMDVCGAQSQGQIGYMIQQTLINHLKKLKLNPSVASIVTQIEVSARDKGFKDPTKPVGPFYPKLEADHLESQGFVVKEDAGRGYRRVVASPLPKNIVEIQAIKTLINNKTTVICSGGGGIPVVKKRGNYQGVAAVIDKDHASELLARLIKADAFIILTDVEKVSLNYNQPNQSDLNQVTIKQAKKYIKQGHFAPGSMAPKVEAAINFVKSGGKKTIITHPFKVLEALNQKTGTHFIK